MHKETKNLKSKRLSKKVDTPFDFSHDSLIRIKIFMIDSDYSILAESVKHIITDGWFTNLFEKEPIETHQQLRNRGEVSLKRIEFQYL
ncbi:hypothetical protein COL87_12335 [Bacillus pseudomycoides]|nr:hypothetical protein BLX05_22030 [Bacillus pseudomycoides]PDY14716.1 hypothetical protein COO16_01345 [Bacillus pseudomycoides]PEI51093.1 hypothetical protein CN641_02990 [Bacillus pseudomycoides]PEM40100.1 hypothetical protein CN634_07985 [Bacillus pseudomycoides]PEU33428.1 hypothetical protein CN535_27010 [Bacillus pseudomycoides]